MSSMEDDAADFLKKIVKTLSMGILWLLILMTMGIYNGWMFFGAAPTLGNYIFYFYAIISFAAVLYYIYRVWRK